MNTWNHRTRVLYDRTIIWVQPISVTMETTRLQVFWFMYLCWLALKDRFCHYIGWYDFYQQTLR